jgi:hypothetical protein
VKAGATNVRDNAILPPTASGDGAGARFVSTDGVRRWRWGALLCVTAAFASLFRTMLLDKTFKNFQKNVHFYWEVTVKSGRKSAVNMRARIAEDAERDELWKRIMDYKPHYGGYQKKTDRLIPLVVLEPIQ